MIVQSPFHEGERMVQEIVGERDIAESNGRIVGNKVPAGAKRFLANLQYCVVTAKSLEGDLWVSFIAGPRGFVHINQSLDQMRLQLSDEAGILSKIPPISDLLIKDNVGLLFIDLATRRRLRVNGRISKVAAEEFAVDIEQAYPNCPKYIQRRTVSLGNKKRSGEKIQEGKALNDELTTWIAGADTMFVGSAHPDGSMDASHRGGRPGFIHVENGVLTIPDYSGNGLFNTLGNLMLNPIAGVTLIDFDAMRQLQMTGEVNLDFAQRREDAESRGSQRTWKFSPVRWIVSPLNMPLEWTYVDASPFNPQQ